MNLALAGPWFRQPGLAGAVGGDEGNEDVWGAGAVDTVEGGGVAAVEGDAGVVAEFDVVGPAVGVADGQLTFGNIWTSRLAAPPGRLC